MAVAGRLLATNPGLPMAPPSRRRPATPPSGPCALRQPAGAGHASNSSLLQLDTDPAPAGEDSGNAGAPGAPEWVENQISWPGEWLDQRPQDAGRPFRRAGAVAGVFPGPDIGKRADRERRSALGQPIGPFVVRLQESAARCVPLPPDDVPDGPEAGGAPGREELIDAAPAVTRNLPPAIPPGEAGGSLSCLCSSPECAACHP